MNRPSLVGRLVLIAAVLAPSLFPPVVTAAEARHPLFARENLVAWCIVPFDKQKRGPEARAAMLEKMEVRQLAYDYRAEHVPTFGQELDALGRHGIRLTAWWFPPALDDEAKQILALLEERKLAPQLWVTGGGGPVENEAQQAERVAAEVARLKPIAEAAAKIGSDVCLYNHGGWFGEPRNQVAVIAGLREAGVRNVGIVYNLHHAHNHIDDLGPQLALMLPHLKCLNINGMTRRGDEVGKKILPLGAGEADLSLLRVIEKSGYTGPIGILNHTDEDAEARLLDNLDGLDWLVKQLDGTPAGAGPKYRSYAGMVVEQR